jgi:mono/diheme cytochrome c family protein
MKYFLCWLALAVLPAAGEPAGVTPITIYTQFQNPAPEPVIFAIQQEVATIMAPLGLPLLWKPLASATGREVAAELAVVTFRGSCDSQDLMSPAASITPLGFTHVSDGVVLPFTEVDCDRVRYFLRKELVRIEVNDRQAVFGRAAARVLSHELFHIFVGTTHHASNGVAKPDFTERELLAQHFRFEASEFRILRASLRSARQQNSRTRSAASPLAGQGIFEESGCVTCHGPSGEGTRFGPGLRAVFRRADAKAFASKFAREVAGMYSRMKSHRLPPPALDDDEIADVMSFLSALE